jgi:hypothetical protein
MNISAGTLVAATKQTKVDRLANKTEDQCFYWIAVAVKYRIMTV